MTTVSSDAAGRAIARARGALGRYRFMAIVTGVMLLILCAEMALKYLFHADDVVRYLRWVPFAHGWIYVVYLVTVFDLWNKMRWSWGRLVAMVLAGVVPVMSFIVEAKLHREAETHLSALDRQYAPAGGGTAAVSAPDAAPPRPLSWPGDQPHQPG